MKTAFITGITGQDGSYLAEFLIEKGYTVHGLIRRSSSFNTQRIEHIYQDPHTRNRNFIGHYGDVLDGAHLHKVLQEIKPDEIYNLAAQSHVRLSFEAPNYSSEVCGLGALNVFEAAKNVCPEARIYQASSSEMFGNSAYYTQDENTSLMPCSPYGAAKVFAYNTAKIYREAYNMFIANGILFNHESPRRAEVFFSRKVCKAAARIALGLQNEVHLGHLEALRDWGYAPDYVEAMWAMLQLDKADDFVIATNTSYSAREFAVRAFMKVGLEFTDYLRFDDRYIRPIEVHGLHGNYNKAFQTFGWKPKYSFYDIVDIMMEAEMETARVEVSK